MSNQDMIRALFSFSQEYSDALRMLNSNALAFFDSEVVKKAMSSVDKIKKSISFESILNPEFQQEIASITRSYKQLVSAFDVGYSISEAIRSAISDIQISALFQLSNSLQTAMIRDLQYCFVNAQYSGIVKVLNEAMACQLIEAPNISFIKTSKLVTILHKELVFPRGFSSSINALNKSTAESIANNNELQYDTNSNHFISPHGSTNSQGLNVICSAKEIFESEADELFTEEELIDFMTSLSVTPMLALQKATANKIYSLLEALFRSGEKTTNFDKGQYYHCRSRSRNMMPYSYDQMLNAPNGLPWAGRFNQVGRSNYYFADSRHGAEAEIKKHISNDDALQTVELLPVKEVKLLDLSGTLARGATFLRYIRFNLSDITDKMPREYLIPCFVSDCCRKIGFDGIKYYGSKEYSNYVTWSDGYFEYVKMYT